MNILSKMMLKLPENVNKVANRNTQLRKDARTFLRNQIIGDHCRYFMQNHKNGHMSLYFNDIFAISEYCTQKEWEALYDNITHSPKMIGLTHVECTNSNCNILNRSTNALEIYGAILRIRNPKFWVTIDTIWCVLAFGVIAMVMYIFIYNTIPYGIMINF